MIRKASEKISTPITEAGNCTSLFVYNSKSRGKWLKSDFFD
jgi:hypothetical protein